MNDINATYANINANNLRTLQQQLSFEKDSKHKNRDKQKLGKYENENLNNSKKLAFALNQLAAVPNERKSLLSGLSYELFEVLSSLPVELCNTIESRDTA